MLYLQVWWRIHDFSADPQEIIDRRRRALYSYSGFGSYMIVRKLYSYVDGCMRCRDLSVLKSLSSDLCHDRCACMAGHTISIKKNGFCGFGGRSHGSCPGSPSGVCVLALSAFRFACVAFIISQTIARAPANYNLTGREGYVFWIALTLNEVSFIVISYIYI